MIHQLKPYPNLKDSGVPWLGDLPAHWQVLPLCAIARPKSIINKEDRDLLSVYLGSGVIRFSDVKEKRTNVTSEDLSKYQAVDSGDLVLNNQQAWRGSVGVSKLVGIVSPAYLVLSLDSRIYPTFADLLFREKTMVEQYLVCSKGVGTIQRNLYWPYLKRVITFIPPESEQFAIVRFVEHVDRQIRRYIRAKQKLIKLLEEQKQVIIHRAVTRGADPNVPLKTSGVEWQSHVPAHWRVLPFTRIAVERADYRGATPNKSESGVFLVTARNIRKGCIDYEVSKEYVAENEYLSIMRRGLPKCGDLLLTMEAPLGHAALVDRDNIALAQRVVRFRFDPALVDPKFILFSVLSPYFQNQLLRRGTGSTAIGMKASKLPQLRLLLPPRTEQQALLSFIDDQCGPLNTAKAKAEAEIELLREFRTRLTADVVTGKLDVRESAAHLPNELVEPQAVDETETEFTSDDETNDAEDETLETVQS